MQQQRTQHPGIAPCRAAIDHRAGIARGNGRLRFDAATKVRAGHDPERAILWRTGIEVHAHGHELFEHLGRRLHEEFAFLFGPPDETRVRDTFSDWNAEVLMDRHQPVA